MAEGSEVTQVQRLQRVELVFGLLVSGATRQQIITFCYEKWFVEEPAVDRYLRDARKYLAEQSDATITQNRNWHIAHRKYMMTKAVKAKNHSLELEVAKDLAKIQGLYVDKIQLMPGSAEEVEETKKAKELLEGTDYKIIEPEGDSEYGS